MVERLVALETSSTRGSVALIEGTCRLDARLVAHAAHDAPNQHAERLLGLLDDSLREVGWDKKSLTRLAVGVGPGSFTGVRVGLSLAQGLMLGLGIPGVGVGSLRAIAVGHPNDDPRLRVVVRDARREEFFVAAYGASGDEVVAPFTIAQAGASDSLRARFGREEFVVLGTQLEGLDCHLGSHTTEPDAGPLGALALDLQPSEHPVSPHYVRGPNVVRPDLPPSPLDGPRR